MVRCFAIGIALLLLPIAVSADDRGPARTEERGRDHEPPARHPVITLARADLETGRLTIQGRDFGRRPQVLLADRELQVLTAGDKEVVALLPTGVEHGTYLLVVARGRDSRRPYLEDHPREAWDAFDSFDLTIGVGLPGPQGPKGDRGAPGPPGTVDQAVIDALQAQINALAGMIGPTITSPVDLPPATAGASYDYALSASGGTPPYRWSVAGEMPVGLGLDSTTGRLAGALEGVARELEIVVQVVDQNGRIAQKTFRLVVEGGQGPPIDLLLLVDTTGDMSGPLSNLKNGLSTLMSSLRAELGATTRIAVAEFRDFPIPPFGVTGQSPDFPYRLRADLTDNTSVALAAVNALTAGGGGDDAESGAEALYLAATGQGISFPGGFVPPGPLSYRPGARRLIVVLTSAAFHDGPEYVAAGILDAHSEAQAIQALDESGICVLAVAVQDASGVPAARATLVRYARATRATVPASSFPGGLCPTGANGAGRSPDADGLCPLVYDVRSDGSGLGAAVVNGIRLLVR